MSEPVPTPVPDLIDSYFHMSDRIPINFLEVWLDILSKQHTNQWKTMKSNIMVRFSSGMGFCFRKLVLPRGLAKEHPEMLKIAKYLVLIDCTRVLPISACKSDAKSIPDAFRHVSDLF